MWQACRGEHGFTLVEVLIAMAVLTIALVGIVGAVVLQSGGWGMAASLSFGHAAVTRGHYVSTATFLAQQRLEQVKRLQYTVGPPAVDQFGVDPIPAGFPDEGFGTIASFPNLSRQVRVQTGVPGANMKTVTVTVGFNLPKDTGIGLESLAVSTLIAARP